MKKINFFLLILLTIFSLSTELKALDTNSSFENELEALEKGKLEEEKIQVRNVDTISDLFSDTVSTGQSSVEKKREEPIRKRRIRSRP